MYIHTIYIPYVVEMHTYVCACVCVMIQDIKYIFYNRFQLKKKLESLNASALYSNRYLGVDMVSPKPNGIKGRVSVSQTPLTWPGLHSA